MTDPGARWPTALLPAAPPRPWLPGIGAATEHPGQDGGAGTGARAGPGQGFDFTGAEGLAAGTAADGGGEVVPAAAVPEH